MGFLRDCGSFDPTDQEVGDLFVGGQAAGSLETLRHWSCEAPILTLPEGVDDFVVYRDASIIGMVAVLMQQGQMIAGLRESYWEFQSGQVEC